MELVLELSNVIVHSKKQVVNIASYGCKSLEIVLE